MDEDLAQREEVPQRYAAALGRHAEHVENSPDRVVRRGRRLVDVDAGVILDNEVRERSAGIDSQPH